MVTKLTLTMEKEVIIKAKAYAKESGRSLSSILENYLKGLTSSKEDKNSSSTKIEIDKKSLTYKISELSKDIKVPKDFDYKKAKDEYMREKFKEFLTNE